MRCVIFHGRVSEIGCSFSSLYLKGGHVFLVWFVGALKTQKLYRHLLEMNTYSVEKATTIRQPSTANLMIDSADRPNPNTTSCWEFQITKNQSIFNGFFSRIGTTEVVLEWCEDNISYDLSNNWVSMNIGGTVRTVSIPSGAYTVSRALNYIAAAFNDISGVTGRSCIVYPGAVEGGFAGLAFLPPTPKIFMLRGPLVNALDFQVFANGYPSNLAPIDDVSGNLFVPDCPDLRLYRYLDFTSEDLTYAQDLKDNSTLPYNRDVLCRWYMDEDVPEEVDALGYPIYMGYRPFRRRRLFNPPKQIKWDNNLPIGNIRFAVYDDNGAELPDSDVRTNWLMTLQLSEN
jgi:hypothetical protein